MKTHTKRSEAWQIWSQSSERSTRKDIIGLNDFVASIGWHILHGLVTRIFKIFSINENRRKLKIQYFYVLLLSKGFYNSSVPLFTVEYMFTEGCKHISGINLLLTVGLLGFEATGHLFYVQNFNAQIDSRFTLNV